MEVNLTYFFVMGVTEVLSHVGVYIDRKDSCMGDLNEGHGGFCP